MSTGWLFRASWPILRPEMTVSQLKVEACRDVDKLAKEAGGRIVGDLSWTVVQGRLVVQAAAMPVLDPAAPGRVYGHVARQVETIRGLAGLRWTDAQIAAAIGCSASGVAKLRKRAGVAPGVGNPALSGEQQQRKGQAA